jgi:hypothetical protein
MWDLDFQSILSDTEKAAWNALNSVCTNFLGNHKAENYREVVSEMLECVHIVKCSISPKLHFLESYPDFFPQNLGEVRDEHGERFHQDIYIMGKWFMGRQKCGMLAEYCWSIVRETPESGYKRKRSRKMF